MVLFIWLLLQLNGLTERVLKEDVLTRFWDIQIVLDASYTKQEQQSAIINSRSMINFIEKQIYPLNFRSEFSRLVINVSKRKSF